MSIAIVLLAAGLGPAASSASETLVLEAEVVVTNDLVRAADLAANALSEDLASVILYPAPAVGHQRRVSADDLRSRFVQVGSRRVPRLRGASAVVIRRSGLLEDPDHVSRALMAGLRSLPLPLGALEQRWEILHQPADLPGRARELEILDPGPAVGRGSVRVRFADRKAFVTVRRSLRVVGVRLRGPAARGAEFSVVPTVADTLWVDTLIDYQNLQPFDAPRDGWALGRSLRAGALLRRSDLRPMDLVHRGQNVEWVVARGDLEIRSTVRARSAGAFGEWILVQSPFDHRLRRVCVVGPGVVSSRPPEPEKVSAVSSRPGGRP